MLQTIEVEIDAQGRVHPVGLDLPLPAGRALLTLLTPTANKAAMLPEAALAEDWLKQEEDEAWAYLLAAGQVVVLADAGCVGIGSRPSDH